MQTSKSQIIKSVLFCTLLVIIICISNFLLVNYSPMQKRFRWYNHEMDTKGEIDMLITGSSLEFDIDAEMASKMLNMHVFTFPMQGGNPETSYYVLLDVLNRNKIKKLIVGWDLLTSFENPHYVYPPTRQAELYRGLFSESLSGLFKDYKINFNLLKISLKKMLEQRYSMTLCEFAVFTDNLFEIPKVLESRKLLKKPFIQTEATTATKGIDINNLRNKKYHYVKNVEETNYKADIDKIDLEYVLKIKDVCEKNNIDLYFITCSHPKILIDNLECFDELHETTINFFKDLRIKFIDGQNPLYFPEADDNLNYSDCDGHFVVSYGEKYTRGVCNWINDNGN